MTTDACHSRTTLLGVTYDCDQPVGHISNHMCHTSADEWMVWEDAVQQPTAAVTDQPTPDTRAIRREQLRNLAVRQFPTAAERNAAAALLAVEFEDGDQARGRAAVSAAEVTEAWDRVRRLEKRHERLAERLRAARQGETEAVRAREAAEADARIQARAAAATETEWRGALARAEKAERRAQAVAATAREEKRRRRDAEAALGAVREAIAGRRAEVADHEAERPPSAWSDAVTVTCDRVKEAIALAALDSSREPATGAAYGPDADDARPWIAEALGLDIETSWGVIADAARTMRRDLAEARNAADPCAHGCRDAADEHTRLSQELDADAECDGCDHPAHPDRDCGEQLDGDDCGCQQWAAEADAESACPEYETEPSVCACGCEGCRHNCAAHQAEPPTVPVLDLLVQNIADAARRFFGNPGGRL